MIIENVMVGYPCKNLTLNSIGGSRTVTKKTLSKMTQTEAVNKIIDLTYQNLTNLLKVLEWNLSKDIKFFRVSSDIIPFGSINNILADYILKEEKIKEKCEEIKKFKEINNMRLSIHPGQYTVLNSWNSEVVKNAILDLNYHNKLSNALGITDIIIHVGGVYNNKTNAMNNFIKEYNSLDENIKEKIRVENDDKSYHLKDLFSIKEKADITIIPDLHHNRCYGNFDIHELRKDILSTWTTKPKLHISTGKMGIADRSHADYLSLEDFKSSLEFSGGSFDIMIESKSKELSVLKLKELIKDISRDI